MVSTKNLIRNLNKDMGEAFLKEELLDILTIDITLWFYDIISPISGNGKDWKKELKKTIDRDLAYCESFLKEGLLDEEELYDCCKTLDSNVDCYEFDMCIFYPEVENAEIFKKLGIRLALLEASDFNYYYTYRKKYNRLQKLLCDRFARITDLYTKFLSEVGEKYTNTPPKFNPINDELLMILRLYDKLYVIPELEHENIYE